MRLGIVGSGMIVKEFLPALSKMEDIEIAGIQGTERSLGKVKELCEEYGISAATDDFEVLCNSGIDTVYIAVPNHLHYDYCKKALEHGLNVIVEKPIAACYAEAKSLAETAQDKELFLFEAVTTQYFDSYEKIKELIPKIGEIKLVECCFEQYSSRYDAFREGITAPSFDPEKAGGAMMDLNVYNISFILGLFGCPDKVHYYANIERGIDTGGIAIMKYPGFVVNCTAAKDCRGNKGAVIQGTKGAISCSDSLNHIGNVRLEFNDGTNESFDGYDSSRVIPEFARFVRAIDENDMEFCRQKLELSLAVSKLMTKLRNEVGIKLVCRV